MSIIGHSSVEEFFHEILAAALSEVGVSTTPFTEYYLVGMLGDFASARISDEPLALRLANHGHTQDRVQALKEIGDTSLYISGFFAESLGQQLVDVDYYIGMGGAAYKELSGRLARSSVAEVYGELASKFPAFVDVLTRMRSQVSLGKQDMVSLYKQWEETKADWIEERLRKLGVIVAAPRTDEGYEQ